MGRMCFVPNCSSKNRSSAERASMFSPPRDPDRLEIWNRNIPGIDRALSPKDKVCEKHFEARYFIRAWSDGLNTIRLNQARLSKDAVPTIFPGCALDFLDFPSSQNKQSIATGQALKDDAGVSEKYYKCQNPIACDASMSGDQCDMEIQNGLLAVTEKAMVGPELNVFLAVPYACDPDMNLLSDSNSNGNGIGEDIKEEVSVLTFQELWDSNCSSVALPNQTWSVHKISYYDAGKKCEHICFSKMFLSKDTGLATIERQLLIDRGLQTKISVHGTEINLPETANATSASDGLQVQFLRDLILQVEKLKVCSGGATFAKYDPASTYSESGKPYQPLKIWRHVKCPVVIDSSPNRKHCSFCCSLRDTMRIQQARSKGTELTKVRTKSPYINRLQVADLRKEAKKHQRIALKMTRKIETLRGKGQFDASF